MNGIKVRGLAVPYGVTNSYGETMLPGAFDKFISYLGNNVTVPMGFEHTRKAGVWTKLWSSGRGLEVEGYITVPQAHTLVLADNIRELSVTWADGGEHPGTVTAARAREKLIYEGISVPSWWRVVPTLTESRDVWLEEISLVSSGAFPGTRLELVGPEAFTLPRPEHPAYYNFA